MRFDSFVALSAAKLPIIRSYFFQVDSKWIMFKQQPCYYPQLIPVLLKQFVGSFFVRSLREGFPVYVPWYIFPVFMIFLINQLSDQVPYQQIWFRSNARSSLSMSSTLISFFIYSSMYFCLLVLSFHQDIPKQISMSLMNAPSAA